MRYYNHRTLRETFKPDAIAVGDLIKLIDGRIQRIEQDDFVLIIHNGLLCFTTRDEIDESERMMKQNNRLLEKSFTEDEFSKFGEIMDSFFGSKTLKTLSDRI